MVIVGAVLRTLGLIAVFIGVGAYSRSSALALAVTAGIALLAFRPVPQKG